VTLGHARRQRKRPFWSAAIHRRFVAFEKKNSKQNETQYLFQPTPF
jgi:hypothetical protein